MVKKGKKQEDVTLRAQKRMIAAFVVVALAFTGLAFRIGWITVVANEQYATLATERQTKDVLIPPRRGAILDRNMTELAVSAVSYRLWVRPANVASGDTEEIKELRVSKTVRMLSEELEMDPESVREMVTRDNVMVRVAKDMSKEKAESIRTRVNEEKLAGIEIEENVSRFYPYGPFAAHLLGTVNDDGNGIGGLELAYDTWLSGISGRWIKNADPKGNSLAYGRDERYEEQNGLNVVLTIDEAIQHYVEKTLESVQEVTAAKRVMAVVMDPGTGDVLAMGMTPDFDPNDPRTPLDPEEAAYVQSLPAEEQVAYWNGMWRNPLISDVYDPGSTFKLLTVSAALEERAATPSDSFSCSGYYQVGPTRLRCWRYYEPHGTQSLMQAVGNSCNPVMIQLAQRMGFDNFYHYIELFGITEKTGIDFPGEAAALIQSRETAGAVGLATMAFGQGIAVTPIQLITAVSAIGNGGNLMQPRLVKALTDSKGDIVESFEPKVVRQVLSEQTAEEMKTIMEYVVSESGGKVASVPGYRIGGKTGTAEKLYEGSYKTGRVTASMVAMAPMDDPKVAVLLIVDEPQGTKFGSTTAGPAVKEVMTDILRYLNIPPQYTQEELAEMQRSYVIVPDVTDVNYSDAAGKLLGSGLTYITSPATGEDVDFMVLDQYPKAGAKLPPGGQVCLYSE
ncbi:MAG: PASTA domain-containing protein [Clostridiales Family XIII bacterium]|jgi:stage V sporulation protein D (sporulation-specific penicillin-binding protein)|nr:PASTA domain-containing protein [Clostridiales Family XIII bacterium]